YLLTPIGFSLLIVTSLYSQTSIGSSIPMLISPHLLIYSPMLTLISLLMLIDFPTLEVMSTYLLTPIGFSLLIVTSLYSQTSIGLSTRMLILPHSLICSSMLTSILLLMLIDFPTLGLMSTYLLTPIDFLQLIVISLCLPISIGSSTRMLISPHLLICSSMPMSISLLMLIDFPILEVMSTCLL
ncbi:TPA: hypothetical protein R1941_002455, partial [Staphylococcus delphini]|nr:hypothetical protein [Staphylococcus delphini]